MAAWCSSWLTFWLDRMNVLVDIECHDLITWLLGVLVQWFAGLLTWLCLVFQLSDLLDKRKQDLQVKLDEIRKELEKEKEEVCVATQSC